MRSRAVCFTSWDRRQLDPTLWASCTFAVWQLEVSPDGGREHWQGYAEFDKAMRFTTLHTYEGFDEPKAHFEMRRGTQAQAIAYCTKEDSRVDGPWEFGEPKNQGNRQDLMNVKVDIDRGYSMKRIADEHFPTWTKYHAAFRQYKRMLTTKRDWPMEIYVILGPSGCGKTQFAHRAFPNAYWKPHGKWWDNYDGHETVVVDEMYGNRFAFTELLNLLDRYPHSVECKGATLEFTSRILVFTSNQEPEDWYDPQRTHQHMAWRDNPLKRRLDEFAIVQHFGSIARVPQLAIVGPVIEGQPRLGAE